MEHSGFHNPCQLHSDPCCPSSHVELVRICHRQSSSRYREYLYGLNTMFLTLRAFGHVMETFKGIGAIQIALFQIIGDVVTIFWQFIATILAFSIAITKVYIAERSFISKTNDAESYVQLLFDIVMKSLFLLMVSNCLL